MKQPKRKVNREYLTSFLRFNEQGICEIVTWYHKHGATYSQARPHKPSSAELERMAANIHTETYPDKAWTR